MKEKKKLKLKKFYLHPITTFLLLIGVVLILSAILSALGMSGSYNKITDGNQLETVFISVQSLLNYDGMKYIFSNIAQNFISFTPLSMLLISLIGISIASSTGLIDAIMKRHIGKINKKTVTFLLILLATISSLINEIGYAVLIPLGALVFLANKRNPLAGIVAAFCGVASGYGVTLFVGSMEVGLIPYTTQAARLIDETFHVSLTSNLFIIIVLSILLSLIGTFIIEKIVVPRLGRYREKEDMSKTQEIMLSDIGEIEQEKLELDKKEKTGLKYALITGVIVILAFVYMIIPNLPFSGMLLDMNETTYLGQLFGDNSYFQYGFTFMIALFFTITGLAYGIGAKSIKNDKELIQKMTEYLSNIGGIIVLIFVVSQFIAIFKKTNIGTVLLSWGAEFINQLSFSGIPLILITLLIVALCNLVVTSPTTKWYILSPVVIPLMMQSNISPQFGQMVFRAGDSMTNCLTPMLAFFAVYIGYLNMYNKSKERPITIRTALRLAAPYGVIMSIVWILLILGWYILGLPIGPGVFPSL